MSTSRFEVACDQSEESGSRFGDGTCYFNAQFKVYQVVLGGKFQVWQGIGMEFRLFTILENHLIILWHYTFWH